MDKQQQQRRHCWKDELLHIDHSLQFEVERAQKLLAPAVLRGEEGHSALMCLDAEGKRDGGFIFEERRNLGWGRECRGG